TATTPSSASCCRATISSRSPTRSATRRPSVHAAPRSSNMSLLLEALKKAERAKEEAQRRSRGGTELSIKATEAPPPAAAEEKPVLTRAELPDIKQPLEILSDDIAP